MSAISHTPSDLRGREHFAPAYGVMLRMCGQLIEESIGAEGTILVLGAGGGLELEMLSKRASAWRFCAVDPDPGMLDAARARAAESNVLSSITWVNGYIFDAPATRCDAATCLSTLHFVPEAEKRATLEAIRARLKPGAPLALVDCCLDKDATDFETRLERYCRHAFDAGAPLEQLDLARSRIRNILHTVSAERDFELLGEASFQRIDLFYAGHSWRGWVAYA